MGKWRPVGGMVEVLFVATTVDVGASAVRFIHVDAREMNFVVRDSVYKGLVCGGG